MLMVGWLVCGEVGSRVAVDSDNNYGVFCGAIEYL